VSFQQCEHPNLPRAQPAEKTGPGFWNEPRWAGSLDKQVKNGGSFPQALDAARTPLLNVAVNKRTGFPIKRAQDVLVVNVL